MNFKVGDTVQNFTTIARVVEIFAAADGAPSDHDGAPILRAVNDRGELVGGKWVADPVRCLLLNAEQLAEIARHRAAMRQFAGLRGRI